MLNSRNKWKVKDNITIILNVINKQELKKNPLGKLKNPDDIMRELKKVMKRDSVDILEASDIYKKEIKKLYNVL